VAVLDGGCGYTAVYTGPLSTGGHMSLF